MFLIPRFFGRIYLQRSFYVFLTIGGSVGTRWGKKIHQLFFFFFSLSPSCLITFWLVFESPISPVLVVWAHPNAKSNRRATEGLRGNLNDHCFIRRKSGLLPCGESRSLFLYQMIAPYFRAFVFVFVFVFCAGVSLGTLQVTNQRPAGCPGSRCPLREAVLSQASPRFLS